MATILPITGQREGQWVLATSLIGLVFDSVLCTGVRSSGHPDGLLREAAWQEGVLRSLTKCVDEGVESQMPVCASSKHGEGGSEGPDPSWFSRAHPEGQGARKGVSAQSGPAGGQSRAICQPGGCPCGSVHPPPPALSSLTTHSPSSQAVRGGERRGRECWAPAGVSL